MRAPLAGVIATAFVIAACGGDGGTDPGNTGGNNGGNTGGNQNPCTSTSSSVTVGNNNFSPACTTVTPGTTVTWTWASGGVAHNVTFGSGPSSGDQGSGTFERAFPTAGTFPYSCTLHGGMNAEIRVVAP